MTSSKILATAVATLFSSFALAQGDECTGALAVGLGANGPFSNAGSTTSAPAWPCGAGGNDVWFSFASGFTGNVTIDLCGANYDTTLQVFDACGGNSLGCNDDFCGLDSSLTVAMNAGSTYFIRVGGFGSGTGNFPLNISIPGDECATAQPVGDGVNGLFSNAGFSTSSPAWPCGAGGTDRWFSYQASCTGTVTVDTCSPGRTYDTTIEVFDSCGGTSLGCNDDFCGLGSSVTFASTIGTTYFIRVGGFGGGSGNFDLTIGCTGVGIANEDCTGALPVVDGLNTGLSNVGASTSSPWPCALGGNDVWYVYTATCCGTLDITTCTPARGFDTALEIFTGNCGSLTSLQCNDDTGGTCGFGSTLSIYAISGFTYYIRLGGFNGAQGSCELNISCTAGAPPNDECTGAIALATGMNGPFTNLCSTTSSGWPCAAGGNDVWFSYTATCTAPHTFRTCGANYDSAIEVFDACGGTSLGCNDDAFAGPCAFTLQSNLTVNLTNGTTYFVRVGGFFGAAGVFPLEVVVGTGAGTIALTTPTACGTPTLALSVTGNPNIGGTVTSALSGNTGLGFVTWGFVPAPLLAPVCPCLILSASTDWQFTNSVNLNIPCDGIFIGTPLETQGADLFGAPAACGFPVPNAFTDIWTVTIG